MTADFDFQEFNQQVIAAFRKSGGVGEFGPVRLDSPRPVDHHRPPQRPVPHRPLGSCHNDSGDLLLFASNMGAPTDPDWLRNIQADPQVVVEIPGRTWRGAAEILHCEERDDAYRRWVEAAPHVADHQSMAGREIPMVRVPTGG